MWLFCVFINYKPVMNKLATRPITSQSCHSWQGVDKTIKIYLANSSTIHNIINHNTTLCIILLAYFVKMFSLWLIATYFLTFQSLKPPFYLLLLPICLFQFQHRSDNCTQMWGCTEVVSLCLAYSTQARSVSVIKYIRISS